MDEIDLGFKFKEGDTVLVNDEEEGEVIRLWANIFKTHIINKIIIDRCYSIKIGKKQNKKYAEGSLKKLSYDKNGIAF